MRNTNDKTPLSSQDPALPAYRSGVAARLAGLPVETLRVWERRYGLSNTGRSAHGQRLYSGEQVRRLGLLKQLVDRGHPIGSLAGLPVEQLEALTTPVSGSEVQRAEAIRLAVIGEGLGRRLAAGGREASALEVLGRCERLAQAEGALAGTQAEVLVVELPELDESAVPLIIAAQASIHAVAVLVLYRFCASATIRALRAQGYLVARVPADMGELTLLCRAALEGKRLAATTSSSTASTSAISITSATAAPAHLVIAPRRFDDNTLAQFVSASNALQCECPRHLADLLTMVVSFERYSAQCASRNVADAELHLELEHAAGAARTILEVAMERLALAEGLVIP
jgi:DNA-binding transcriptional MerR regulator